VRRWLAEERGYRGEGEPPAIPDEVAVEAAAATSRSSSW
jgi:hypothetical protein